MLSLLVIKITTLNLTVYIFSRYFYSTLLHISKILFPHPPTEVTLSIHHSFRYSPLPGGGWKGGGGRAGREKNWDLEKFLNRKLWSNKSGEGEREIERGNIRSGDYIKQRAGGWGGELEVWKWEWSVEWGRGGYYPAPVAQGWIMLWQEPPPVECGDMCPCARLSLSHHIVGSLSRCSDL